MRDKEYSLYSKYVRDSKVTLTFSTVFYELKTRHAKGSGISPELVGRVADSHRTHPCTYIYSWLLNWSRHVDGRKYLVSAL